MRFYFPYASVPGGERVKLTATAPPAFRAQGLGYSFSTARAFEPEDMRVNLTDAGDKLVFTLLARNKSSSKQWRLRAFVYDKDDPMALLQVAERRLSTLLVDKDYDEEEALLLRREIAMQQERARRLDDDDADVSADTATLNLPKVAAPAHVVFTCRRCGYEIGSRWRFERDPIAPGVAAVDYCPSCGCPSTLPMKCSQCAICS